jgi:DNA-binding transcriptional ArsR family regulator
VSDTSQDKGYAYDVEKLILRALARGSKTPEELFTAVKKVAGVNRRTYYRHLENLLKRGQIEEVSETKDGRLVNRYAQKKPEPHGVIVPMSKQYGFVPTRRLLELAACMKLEPDGWPKNDETGKAKLLHDYCLVPKIMPPYEDPDAYAFVWPREAGSSLSQAELVSSRFFRPKSIYKAIAEETELLSGCGDVFVGFFGSDAIVETVTAFQDMAEQLDRIGKPSELNIIERPYSVCVAVCRKTDGSFQVVHVEEREGKIDKSWEKGLCKQLKAKKSPTVTHDSLKDDAKRKMLTRLREILDVGRLSIPSRYVKLIEELLDYGYQIPSSGYVLSLALATSSSC